VLALAAGNAAGDEPFELSEETTVATLVDTLFPKVGETERDGMKTRISEKAARDVAGLVLLEKEEEEDGGVKSYLKKAVSPADAIIIVNKLKTLATWPSTPGAAPRSPSPPR